MGRERQWRSMNVRGIACTSSWKKSSGPRRRRS
jgi:hypothetical protein